MSYYYLDEKYLLMISSRLPLFKRKGNNVFNHRCPICDDSKKNPTKCRGYHFENEGSLFYKCWNCGVSMPTSKFIEIIDPDMYREYRMEVFRETKGTKKVRKVKKATKKAAQKPIAESLFDGLMDNVKTLPSDHIAVKMLNERMIPKDRWKDLYHLDDMRKIGQLKDKYKDRFKSGEPRLVIAYRGRDGHVKTIACRSYEKDAELRYINIRIDENHPQVYGYDRVDLTKKIPVLEGAFDAMFIPNCVGMSGSNLMSTESFIPKDQSILIFDPQPRNKQIVELIRKAIESNFTVALLPETGYKDINAMIQGGVKLDKILKMIEENTVRGLRAKLKFKGWKKIG